MSAPNSPTTAEPPDVDGDASGVSAPSLPLVLWERSAQRLSTVKELWALHAACRETRPLWEQPSLAAWRKAQVLNAVRRCVHDINVEVRCCKDTFALESMWQLEQESFYDGMCIFSSDEHEDGVMEDGMPAADYEEQVHEHCYARMDHLHKGPDYATASMHRAILARPRLAAILGPDRCAAMLTPADEAIEADLERTFPMHDYHFGNFIGPQGSWVTTAVTKLEQLAEMVQGGLRLHCPVPPPYPGNKAQPKYEALHAARDKPLRTWLAQHAQFFGAPFVDALMGLGGAGDAAGASGGGASGSGGVQGRGGGAPAGGSRQGTSSGAGHKGKGPAGRNRKGR